MDETPPESLLGPGRQAPDLVLLPSICFGAPFSLQPVSKQVFITPTLLPLTLFFKVSTCHVSQNL